MINNIIDVHLKKSIENKKIIKSFVQNFLGIDKIS